MDFLELFLYVIIIFCSRGSKWEGKIWDHPPKIARKSFWPAHIDQSRYSIFKKEKYFTANVQIFFCNGTDFFLNIEKILTSKIVAKILL